MKKFCLLILGIIAGIVAFVNIGSLLALALSGLMIYAGYHFYKKHDSVLLKLFWGGVLLIGFLTAVGNVPAFIGIVALLGLYYVWRKWNDNENRNVVTKMSDDPFVNFERQWNELNK